MELAVLSTEAKIKEAAVNVFIRKGFSATRMRDIAEEAEINTAALHYYFRSKDKLFEFVANEVLSNFSQSLDAIFNADTSLENKIRTFADQYTDFARRNPPVSLFIITEAHRNPEKIEGLLSSQLAIEKLKNQLQDLANRGVIRRIHPAHFIMSLVGMTVFPFIAQPLFSRKIGLPMTHYESLLEERKELIPEMMINYLFVGPKSAR